MVARPRRTVQGKALRLACWNANGVRVRKLQQKHFLYQHGVNICLFLNPGQALRLAYYVYHHTNILTAGCGTATLIRHGIFHRSVPVQGLTHLEATAIEVIMASRPGITL